MKPIDRLKHIEMCLSEAIGDDTSKDSSIRIALVFVEEERDMRAAFASTVRDYALKTKAMHLLLESHVPRCQACNTLGEVLTNSGSDIVICTFCDGAGYTHD